MKKHITIIPMKKYITIIPYSISIHVLIPNLAILLVTSSRIRGLASWCFNQPI